MWLFFCLDCLEEAVARASPEDRPRIAVDAAEAAIDAVRIDETELRAAARSPAGFATALATDKRRDAMRRRIRRELRNARLPALSAALEPLLEESERQPPEADPLWNALCAVLGQSLGPYWN